MTRERSRPKRRPLRSPAQPGLGSEEALGEKLLEIEAFQLPNDTLATSCEEISSLRTMNRANSSYDNDSNPQQRQLSPAEMANVTSMATLALKLFPQLTGDETILQRMTSLATEAYKLVDEVYTNYG